MKYKTILAILILLTAGVVIAYAAYDVKQPSHSTLYTNNILAKDAGDINLVGNFIVDGELKLKSGQPIGAGYWAKANSDISYTEGSVGIGTATPSGKLHIIGSGTSGLDPIIKITGNNGADALVFGYDFGSAVWRFRSGGTNSPPIVFNMGSLEKMRITNAGRIGINTADPTALLDVNGDIKASGTICDGSGNCLEGGSSKPTPAAYYYPMDVKATIAAHNGQFAPSGIGYANLHQWIQDNGCSGYHVCTPGEIVAHMSHTGIEVPSGWLQGGGNQEAFRSGFSILDCKAWTSNAAPGDNSPRGIFWDTAEKGANLATCDVSKPVLCCK